MGGLHQRHRTPTALSGLDGSLAGRRSALWHPFSDISRLSGREVTIVRGDGVWVYDSSGERYLDASAALWYCNIGHGRKELAAAASGQMQRLAGYQIFDVFGNEPAYELAERLRDLAPLGDSSAVFFTSGGSDSIDTAAKIARRYWVLKGQPQRQVIVCRQGAYHGVNGFGTSLSGIEPNASGWGPLVPRVMQVGRHDLGALERTLDEHAGHVAAFIGEPVQGAAGVHPPADGYWQGVQDLCRAHDVLVIADEVVTGFGRLGQWFGSERYGIEPDLITCAKGLSSGYMPIGAVVASPKILDVLWAPDAGPLRHGYTYSGHPAACAVALANLDLLELEEIPVRVAGLEPAFAKALGALGSSPLVEEVRTAGLLCGVELSAEARQADPSLVERVVVEARQRGVLVRNLLGATLQISPPLIITVAEIGLIAQVLQDALRAVAGT